jgi:DNA-binding FadR family transcriptional regulator
LEHQSDETLTDEAFCASDVAFHRALVDAAGNPVLSFQLAGAVEGMQPLMNMITFSARSRAKIVALHKDLLDALAAHDGPAAEEQLVLLEVYTRELAAELQARHASKSL